MVKAEAQKLVAAGHRVLEVRCDVSDDAQVAAMVDRTVAEFGRLDAAFNNAGVMARIAPTADSTREEWDRVIGINLRGVWSSMKYELRQMQRQGSGAIVNNASVAAHRLATTDRAPATRNARTRFDSPSSPSRSPTAVSQPESVSGSACKSRPLISGT